MSQINEPEEYIAKEEGIFRNRLWLNKYASLETQIKPELRKIPPDAIMAELWNHDRIPEYFEWKDKFYELCKSLHISWHNAIAFWHCLLDNSDKLLTQNSQLYNLIFCGVCNYGDFFLAALSRNIPEDMPYPGDAIRWPKDIEFEIRNKWEELIKQQVGRRSLSIPEKMKSIDGFDNFRTKWNQHLQGAKQYCEWEKRYAAIDKSKQSTKSYGGNHCHIKALAEIFRQYIAMLNDFSNSKHDEFSEAWNEFNVLGRKKMKETSYIFCSFERITGLLKEVPDIAQIAPIYVLALFRTYTKRLYQNNTGISFIDKLSVKKIRGDDKNRTVQFRKEAPVNTTSRRDAQLAIYQILCIYFQVHSDCLCIPFDSNLCDYMLQTAIPLLGARRFEITEATVESIISSDATFPLKAFEKSQEWVHPLLEEVQKRLKVSLNLVPDKMPHIFKSTGMSPNSNSCIDAARKFVDDQFLERYLEILVYADGGIGYPQFSDPVMESFSDLLDKAIQESPYVQKRIIDINTYQPSDLYSFETGIHMACNSRIFKHYYEEIILFLYEYFQSTHFCSNDPIPNLRRSFATDESKIVISNQEEYERKVLRRVMSYME